MCQTHPTWFGSKSPSRRGVLNSTLLQGCAFIAGEYPQDKHRPRESIPTRRMPDACQSCERAGNALIFQKRNDGLVQRLRALSLGGGLQASCRKWARCKACGLANPGVKFTRQSDLADRVQRYKHTA